MQEQELHDDFDSVAGFITKWIHQILSDVGVSDQWINYTKVAVLLIIAVVIVYLLQFIVKHILVFIIQRIMKVTKLSFLKYSLKNRLPHYLTLIIPYTFIRGAIPIIFYDFKTLISPFTKIVDIYFVFIIIWTIMSIIKSFADVLQEKPAFQNKPMKSYTQVIQIIFFIFGAVAIYSIVTGRSATAFFAAMGAASAILLLMFKDTIMGFVGSIQISTNNMVQIGDWITMNKYGADGDVEEINLTTVKVRNFDKTITTIPTYALISDSFQNWRGMQESGGRRIKRSLFIKQNSIHFLTNEQLEKYKEIKGLSQYITDKQEKYKLQNGELNDLISVNPNQITNNELFMQYAMNYLKEHPGISKTMTLMVRQMAPTPQGLPIEIYTFTATTAWTEYEGIMAGIMNHLISAVKYFDLIIFEESAGTDSYNVYMRDAGATK